jgi:hypothetical protein
LKLQHNCGYPFAPKAWILINIGTLTEMSQFIHTFVKMLQNSRKPLKLTREEYMQAEGWSIRSIAPRKNPVLTIVRALTRSVLFIILLVVSAVILAPLALLSDRIQGHLDEEGEDLV